MITKGELSHIKTQWEYEKLLLKNGYTKRSCGGSHVVFCKDNTPSLPIPYHGELSKGVKRNIDKLILGESYYQKENQE